MGSAFAREPLYGILGCEVVTFRNAADPDADLVVHLPHPECAKEGPHRMSECGRFAEPPPPA
jgi:hypothetical protein